MAFGQLLASLCTFLSQTLRAKHFNYSGPSIYKLICSKKKPADLSEYDEAHHYKIIFKFFKFCLLVVSGHICSWDLMISSLEQRCI
jgi:hypothetical protein